jgi:nucleotide-binding universal stress UspA family protein
VTYTRILVAVDGSEVSQPALREAVRLAGLMKATLCIAHGVNEVTTNVDNSQEREEFLRPRVEAGRALLKQAAALATQAGTRVQEHLLEIDAMGRGRLAEAVVHEAETCGADLIVVGTHARRGVSHLLLGSVAEGIVRIAPKPVLVVTSGAASSEAQDKRYGKVLVAVDGTPVSEPALDEAIRLAQVLELSLRVVHAADAASGGSGAAQQVLEAAQSKAQEAGVQVETQLLEAARGAGSIAGAVAADAERWPADLLVVGTHGRHGLDRLRLGSVAEDIVHRAPAPVLLVRAAPGTAAE